MNRRVHIVVEGRVQGVCFRYYTREQGRRLGLRGWVRNLADGSVEIAAEGQAERVNELIAWARQGPPAARVDAVEADYEEPVGGLEPFGIRY